MSRVYQKLTSKSLVVFALIILEHNAVEAGDFKTSAHSLIIFSHIKSSFLRRPQTFDKISQFFFDTVSTSNKKWKILSAFCGLLL